MKGEKRGTKRHRTTGPVHYCCGNVAKNTVMGGTLPDMGVVLNSSDAGLCFLATCPLQVGQSLVVNCPWVSDKTVHGTVRWCAKAAVDLWRVGLEKSH